MFIYEGSCNLGRSHLTRRRVLRVRVTPNPCPPDNSQEARWTPARKNRADECFRISPEFLVISAHRPTHILMPQVCVNPVVVSWVIFWVPVEGHPLHEKPLPLWANTRLIPPDDDDLSWRQLGFHRAVVKLILSVTTGRRPASQKF